MPFHESPEVLLGKISTQNDPQAFSALYDLLSPIVFGLAKRILRDGQQAEDALQEIFIFIWEKAGSYDAQKGSVENWARVITRSRCIDKIRKRSSRQDKEEPFYEETFQPSGGLNYIIRDLELDDARKRIGKALGTLPPAQRSAIELAHFEGMTQQEIAERFEEPLGTIKTRMRLGMLKLAELLDLREAI